MPWLIHVCILHVLYIDQNAWGHAFLKGGVCDTLGNSGFSGELVSFEELGQPELINEL